MGSIIIEHNLWFLQTHFLLGNILPTVIVTHGILANVSKNECTLLKEKKKKFKKYVTWHKVTEH